MAGVWFWSWCAGETDSLLEAELRVGEGNRVEECMIVAYENSGFREPERRAEAEGLALSVQRRHWGQNFNMQGERQD